MNAAKSIVGATLQNLKIARGTIERYLALKKSLNESSEIDEIASVLTSSYAEANNILTRLYNREVLTQDEVRTLLNAHRRRLKDSPPVVALDSAIECINYIHKEYQARGDVGNKNDREGELTVKGLESLTNGLNFARAGLLSDDMQAYCERVEEGTRALREEACKQREQERKAAKEKTASVCPVVSGEELGNKIKFFNVDDPPPGCRPEDIALLKNMRENSSFLQDLYRSLSKTDVVQITFMPRTWVLPTPGSVNVQPEQLLLFVNGNKNTALHSVRHELNEHGYQAGITSIKDFDEYTDAAQKTAELDVTPYDSEESPLQALVENPSFMSHLAHYAGCMNISKLSLRESPAKIPGNRCWNISIAVEGEPRNNLYAQAIQFLFDLYGSRVTVERDKGKDEGRQTPKWLSPTNQVCDVVGCESIYPVQDQSREQSRVVFQVYNPDQEDDKDRNADKLDNNSYIIFFLSRNSGFVSFLNRFCNQNDVQKLTIYPSSRHQLLCASLEMDPKAEKSKNNCERLFKRSCKQQFDLGVMTHDTLSSSQHSHLVDVKCAKKDFSWVDVTAGSRSESSGQVR